MRPPAKYLVEGTALAGTPTLPTVAKVLTLTSDDAGEACAILIRGLGAAYVAQEETVVLAGTTPKVTTSTWLRVNRVLLRYGASNALEGSEGRIGVTHPDVGELVAVEAGALSSASALYSTPPSTWTPEPGQDDPTRRFLYELAGVGPLAVKCCLHATPETIETVHSCNGGEPVAMRPLVPFDGDVWLEGTGAVSFDLVTP